MKNITKNITLMTAASVLTLGTAHASNSSDKSNPTARTPLIPTSVDFVWEGTFRSNGPTLDARPVTAPLIIQGQRKGDYYNLYMQQGSESDPNVWVENFIYMNDMYTMTHRWHGEDSPIPLCFKSINVRVDHLNDILKSSQFVARETINSQEMNHFRTSCISSANLWGMNVRTHIFSDIYVNPENPEMWYRWLQFGDGVGLDLHHDEWFIFDEPKNDKTKNDIKLPEACTASPIIIDQGVCTNLIQEK